jgi:(2Fe-2S) ferredoxin
MGKFHFGKEVSAFSLEGKFLNFEFEDGYKRKYLQLESSEGEYCIKLAKYLRSSFALDLTPGDRVQIFGEKKFNPKKGTLTLKAERVILIDRKQAPAPVPIPTKPAKAKASILVCQKSDCMKRGGREVCQALQAALGDRGLENEVAIKATGCLKQCKAGPNLVVMPDKTRYSRVCTEQIPELIDKHFQQEQQAQPSQLEVNVDSIAAIK